MPRIIQRPWVALQTGLSLDAGRRVSSRCEQAGIRSYFPQIRIIQAARGRTRSRISPLWPGYVMARVGVYVDEALRIRDVSGVVRRGDHCCRLSDAQLGEMRDDLVRLVGLEDECGVFTVHPPVPSRFRRGERIRVQGAGPFAGRLVEYVGMDEDSRHHAFVEWFGKLVDAAFDNEELAAA